MNALIRLFALPCAMFVGVVVAAPALHVPTGSTPNFAVWHILKDWIKCTCRLAGHRRFG